MTEHTPGPWTRDGTCVYALGPEGTNVFSFNVQGGGCSADVASPEELEANAILAEVAPYMLAALQEIAEARGARNIDPLKHADNCIADMRGLAKTAIAKALGQ